ncbi:MAG: RloB family protein [Cyanobacteriota bacterium]|nr:RloB family protein [Cyanobacteriota bacterium]
MSRKRGKKKKQLKPSIYIVCEGTNTERIYFEAIAEQDDVFQHFAITVYPSEEEQIKALKNPGESIKTDAKNLVKIACEASRDYDEVWAVFDKDGYTKHQEAFENAKKPGRGKKVVNIAFSSIAIEHWILLHYERNKTAFNKSRDAIDYLLNKDYFPGYSKKANIEIYSSLKELTQTAIENAAWLRMEMETELQAKDGKIYELNPYVTVDELVKKLLSFNPVTYGKINQIVGIVEISIKINSRQQKKNILKINLTIINHQKIGYLINREYLFVTNELGDKFLMSNVNEVIDPETEKNITLDFLITNSSSNLRFNFIGGDRHLIIDL